MDVVEKWGDDIDSAVNLALQDLKLTRDEVEVTVLEEPSRGFFGIGSKLAKVRVTRIKPEEPEIVETKAPAKKPEGLMSYDRMPKTRSSSNRKDNKKRNKNNNNNKNKEKRPAEKRDAQPAKKEPRKDAPKAAPKAAVKAAPAEKAEKAVENGFDEINFRSAMKDLPVTEDHPALLFLKDVTSKMGLDVDMTARAGDDSVLIDISGKDSRTIIGKRGQTLDALQYLTSLVVNRDSDDYVKVVIDVENYRSRREKTLEQLADRLAKKVVRTRKSVRLEPMNPYERKVIHATLQKNPKVVTRSEGQDPYRRVIIELK